MYSFKKLFFSSSRNLTLKCTVVPFWTPYREDCVWPMHSVMRVEGVSGFWLSQERTVTDVFTEVITFTLLSPSISQTESCLTRSSQGLYAGSGITFGATAHLMCLAIALCEKTGPDASLCLGHFITMLSGNRNPDRLGHLSRHVTTEDALLRDLYSVSAHLSNAQQSAQREIGQLF